MVSFNIQSISVVATTGEKLKEFSASQASDAVCSQVMKYCQFGWPEKHRVTDDIKPYWALRGYLTVHNGLLLYGRRIVIPVARQRDPRENTSGTSRHPKMPTEDNGVCLVAGCLSSNGQDDKAVSHVC